MIQNNSILNLKSDNFNKVDGQTSLSKADVNKEPKKFEKILSKEVDKNTTEENETKMTKDVKKEISIQIDLDQTTEEDKDLESLSILLSLLNKLNINVEDVDTKVKIDQLKVEIDQLLEGQEMVELDLGTEAIMAKVESLFKDLGFTLDLQKDMELAKDYTLEAKEVELKASEELVATSEKVLEKDDMQLKPQENIFLAEESNKEIKPKEAEKSKPKEVDKISLEVEPKDDIEDLDTETELDKGKEDSSKFANFESKVTLDGKLPNKTEAITSFTNNIELPEEQVIKQVVSKLDFKLSEGKNEVTIQLKPEILGNLKMDIELEKGTITAKILVDNYKTKEIIENNLNVLQNKIEENGMEIKTVQVSVGNNADFEKKNQEQQFENFNRHAKKLKAKKDKMVISQNYEANTLAENYENQVMEEGMNLFV